MEPSRHIQACNGIALPFYLVSRMVDSSLRAATCCSKIIQHIKRVSCDLRLLSLHLCVYMAPFPQKNAWQFRNITVVLYLLNAEMTATDSHKHMCTYALQPVAIGVNDVPFLETIRYTVICMHAGEAR